MLATILSTRWEWRETVMDRLFVVLTKENDSYETNVDD